VSTIGCLTGDSAAPLSAEARQRVLVVDFGAQYAQLIARRVREHSVYSEIVPHRLTAAEFAERPQKDGKTALMTCTARLNERR
jgi:hypothetical protein